jgi:oligopeptide transport system ATP-binding protein
VTDVMPRPLGDPPAANEPVLRAVDLVKEFTMRGATRGSMFERRTFRAVDSVRFDLHAGETLGIVGESGCGKSTLARLVTRLVEPTSGSVHFQGADLAALGRRELRAARRGIQLVFQDPYSSLNPRMTVEELVGEGWIVHRDIVEPACRPARLRELLDLVGLGQAAARRYPHEFSGGQRQRIGIARALAVGPAVLICDEAVSALDVSTQAQIVNLLKDIQDATGIAYVFISHDLGVVRAISHRVKVMYLGRFVESAPEAELYGDPAHPYTKALLAAAPRTSPDQPERRHRTLDGELPDLLDVPGGCAFRTRCWKATARCEQEVPELRFVHEPSGHAAACFHPDRRSDR